MSPPTAEDSNAEATKKTSGEFTPAEQDSGLPVWVPIARAPRARRCRWWRRLVATEDRRGMTGPRPARDLHPGAWWLWAMGLAAAATVTTNPFLLLLIVGVAA